MRNDCVWDHIIKYHRVLFSYFHATDNATQLKPTCKMCKILAIIVQVPCNIFLARLAEYVQNTCKNSWKCKGYVSFLAHFVHNMQASCTSNSARTCKQCTARFLPARLYLARRRMQVSCKENVHFLHVTCTKCVPIFSFLARNHAKIARF